MLIGVVSDNHRLIDPALPSVLAGVEEIWHAGDLVTSEILPALKAIAPVRVVRGNNDLSRDLPEQDVFEREGWRILLRHIVGPPGKVEREARETIAREKPDVLVMGHSHKPLAESAGGVIYLNPGSCGPRRFSLPRTAARLQITRDKLVFTVVDLDSRKTVLERQFP